MANTFLAARGTDVGKSLCEHDLADTAKQIMIEAADGRLRHHPAGRRRGRQGIQGGRRQRDRRHRRDVPADDMILDVGAETVERINADWIDARRDPGLERPARRLRDRRPSTRRRWRPPSTRPQRTKAGKLVSVAGGGDTVAALNHAGVADDFTYVSTAGGAFLEWMEGKALPGVDVLKR